MKSKPILCLALVLLAAWPAFAASGMFPKMRPATNANVLNIHNSP
jgi:hypothetical protein